MITILWLILVFAGLYFGPKIAEKLLRVNWGRSFAKDLAVSLFVAFTAASPEKFYRLTKERSPTPRIQQLWLAMNTLALAWLMIVMFLTQGPLYMLQDGIRLFQSMIDPNNPPDWVFWLGYSDWWGISLGLLSGTILRLVFRFTGLSLSLATGFLVVGLISMPVAWGLFLGDFLVGAIENHLRNRQRLFQYKTKFSLAFGLGGLLLAPLILGFSMDMTTGIYSTQLRWVQWFSMVVTFLVCETMASTIFFHFHWEQQSKLTKV